MIPCMRENCIEKLLVKLGPSYHYHIIMETVGLMLDRMPEKATKEIT